MAGTVAATGGTFDIIHSGHLALLAAAVRGYDHTIIGLSSDAFAARRGKDILNRYDTRLARLRDAVESHFSGSSYEICPLEDDFGPAVLREGVDCIVVSQETADQGDALNRLRAARGLPGVDIVVVPMVLGSDGTRISTSSIRRGLTDTCGNVPGSD